MGAKVRMLCDQHVGVTMLKLTPFIRTLLQCKWLVVSLIVLACVGCGKSASKMDDYRTTLRSGQKEIPWVATVERYFPAKNIDHFITHYGFDSDPKEWQTVVYFEGRYRMQITQDVEIDYRKNRIVRALGEMKFVINEVAEIEAKNLGASYSGQARGGPKEWKNFEDAKGKLSSLPLRIRLNDPVANFDAYRAAWGKDIVK